MARSDLQPDSVPGNPPDDWRKVGDVVAALDMPVRSERHGSTLMFGMELALRTAMSCGCTQSQAKQLLLAMRPAAIGILSNSELLHLMYRLRLEKA